MVRWTIAAIATFSLLGASVAAADEAAIAVEGNHRLGTDSIRAYFHPSENGRLSDADLDAALKAMYRSGEFSKVAIRRDGGVVRVTIDENPVIARIAFEGNRKLSDDKLKPLLLSRKDGPLSQPIVQEDVRRLLEAYRHSGRFNAEVAPQTIGQANGRVVLLFAIK
jgi:outer membrane protein insertion porin family